MEETPSLLQIFINWLPFFVYLLTIVYVARIFNRYARDRAAFHKSALEQMQRQTQAVEKIAASLPKRD